MTSLATFPRSSQIRALVDCDSFYAGCEVARNPSLLGKPVCVARERDIVLAATYEAKKYGIRTGTPAREAKRILGKDAVFIEPDMAFYVSMSDRMMEILREESNEIEIFSIDEAFIDITHITPQDENFYEETAFHIQNRIRNETGVSVSIGVAPTRLLAKMFAPMRKPKGVFACLDPNKIDEIIMPLPITHVPFIASRRASRLGSGCKTVGDFMRRDEQYIQHIMGQTGLKLRRELQGSNAISLKKKEKQKSIERTRSFHPDFTSDREILWSYVMHNFEKAYRELIECGGSIRSLKVSFRTKEFWRHAQYHRFPGFTSNKKVLLEKTKELFDLAYDPQSVYRTTGVGFGEISYQQQKYGLFDEKLEKQDKVQDIIAKLNDKFGKIMVTSASDKAVLTKYTVEDYEFMLGEVE